MKTTLLALLAAAASAVAQPTLSIRLAPSPTGSGVFRVLADSDAPALTFRQARFYETFTFDLSSEPATNGAPGIYRHRLRAGVFPRGRVAPREYYWTGPMCKRVVIIADPLRARL